MSLKNMWILITAGPTWVPIDKVRVISNIATGQTGIMLAEEFSQAGAKVTLLLGPPSDCVVPNKIRVLRFRFFDELKQLIKKELSSFRYSVVIHSAAVSDYRAARVHNYKLKSNLHNLKINLVPTEKIINSIKKNYPALFLVGFKFEPDLDKDKLIEKARLLIKRANCDLVVANSNYKGNYLACILGKEGIVYGYADSKKKLAKKLVSLIKDFYEIHSLSWRWNGRLSHKGARG